MCQPFGIHCSFLTLHMYISTNHLVLASNSWEVVFLFPYMLPVLRQSALSTCSFFPGFLTCSLDTLLAVHAAHRTGQRGVHLSKCLCGELSEFQFKKITTEYDYMYGRCCQFIQTSDSVFTKNLLSLLMRDQCLVDRQEWGRFCGQRRHWGVQEGTQVVLFQLPHFMTATSLVCEKRKTKERNRINF